MILVAMVVTSLAISGILTLFKKHLFIDTVRVSYFSSLATLSIFSVVSLFFRAPTSLLTFLIAVVSLAVILKLRYKWDNKRIALAIGRYSVPVSIIAHFYFFLYGERMAYQESIITIVGDGWGFYFLVLALTLGMTYLYYNYVFTKGFGAAKYKRYDPTKEADLQRRGNEGEMYINSVLERSGFTYLHDVLLYKKGLTRKEDKATQIDHITFVGDDEIWVIETKNWKGTIELDFEQYETKVTYPNGDVRKMYNPILQNENHVNAIRSLLERRIGRRKFNKKYKMVNVIVFIGQTFEYTEDDLVILGSDVFESYIESGAISPGKGDFSKIQEIIDMNDHKNDPRAVKAHRRIIEGYKK